MGMFDQEELIDRIATYRYEQILNKRLREWVPATSRGQSQVTLTVDERKQGMAMQRVV